jgi:hypothetical protein
LVLVTVATIAKLFLLVPMGILISVAALVAWLWPNHRDLEWMRTSSLPVETGLPIFTTGPKSLGWLGLLFLMSVLGWCLGTLFYTYFYLRLYSEVWPPDDLPMPGIAASALPYAIVILAALPLGFAWRTARLAARTACMGGLAAGSLLLALFVALHFVHLSGLEFLPQTNAYGSIFFVLSWAIDLLAVIAMGLASTAAVRLWREGDHWQLYLRLHVQMTAHFAYFTAATALIVFAVLYLSPYVL